MSRKFPTPRNGRVHFTRRSISLPADLVEAVRAQAAAEERSFSAIICRAVRRELEGAGRRVQDIAGTGTP